MTFTIGSTTRTIPNFPVYHGQFGFGVGDLVPQTDIGVGTHSINVSYPEDSGTATSAPNAAKVIITPTAILTTTTISPDPSNSGNAIITSQLSGKYIDQLPTCQCEGQNGYLMPAGTWSLAVTDSSGNTVLSKNADQAANGLPTFVNYWPSVPAGDTFTAQSTFTPAGNAKSNFTLTSQKFSWTSKKSAGEQGPGSPSTAPRPTTVKTAAFAPPLIVFWALLLVTVILIALDTLLLVSNWRVRKSRAAQGEVVAS